MAAKPKGFLVKAMAEGVMHPLSTGLSAAEISDIADYIHSTGGR
jgi:cytochrome c553